MNPQGDLGSADLLRALALAGEDEARQHRYADLLGYAYAPQPERQADAGIHLVTKQGTSGKTTEHIPAATLPIRHRVRLYGLLEAPQNESLPEPLQLPRASQGLSEADCLPRQPLAPLRLAPLVPPKRLWPALKPLLQTLIPGGPDLPALQHHLARARLPRVMPRRWRSHEAAPLVVVLDQARHLAPLALDLQLVAGEIQRLAAQGGLHGYRVAGHPQALQACWGAGRRDAEGRPHIPPGARVLVISDLGQARQNGADAMTDLWRIWCAALERKGCQVRVISPVSHAAPGISAYHTLAGGRLHRPRPAPPPPHLQAALERYQCALAFAVQVEPELLRDLRRADPALAPYPELESLHRQSPHVAHAEQPTLHPAAAAHLRPGLKTWSIPAQRRLLQILRATHAGDYRAVEMTEILLWSAHAGAEARALEQSAIDQAEAWYAGFEQDLESDTSSRSIRDFAHAVWAVAAHDTPMQALYSRWLTPFWALDEHRRQAPPPSGLHPDDLRRVMGRLPEPMDCLLVQQGDWLLARPAGALEVGHSPVAGPFLTRSIQVEQGGAIRRHIWQGYAPALGRLSEGEIRVRLDGVNLRVGELEVPWWALEAGRSGEGAYCEAPMFYLEKMRLFLPLNEAQRFTQPRFGNPGSGFFSFDHGLDEYGWYADLNMQFGGNNITQRLRWIPPGDFLMGSPQDEPESSDNEHPRHRVLLTQGYWLADTACTQELWQAVMRSNPSYFTGDPELPVENVSWNDIQPFLKKLTALTGQKAELPSEAQWEYACRAGTITPFWWGDSLGTDNANYNSGVNGEARQSTQPVKTFRPNPWGLWQMHGNVLEWCQDGRRVYAKDVAVDPEGALGGSHVLRGGSWIRHDRGVRAANRDSGKAAFRARGIGFRFLLRSPDPGARRAEG